jgi:hypothetical protein
MNDFQKQVNRLKRSRPPSCRPLSQHVKGLCKSRALRSLSFFLAAKVSIPIWMNLVNGSVRIDLVALKEIDRAASGRWLLYRSQ